MPEIGDWVPDFVPEHLVDPGRPEGVPDDWKLYDCANPDCAYTVWAPDVGDVGSTNVLMVCGTPCATVMMGKITGL